MTEYHWIFHTVCLWDGCNLTPFLLENKYAINDGKWFITIYNIKWRFCPCVKKLLSCAVNKRWAMIVVTKMDLKLSWCYLPLLQWDVTLFLNPKQTPKLHSSAAAEIVKLPQQEHIHVILYTVNIRIHTYIQHSNLWPIINIVVMSLRAKNNNNHSVRCYSSYNLHRQCN